jgi:hypothetical protein
MKTVTILLTKFTDVFGKFVSWYSHGGYTHASISIDEDEEIFYSFNYKGFVIEKPKKRTPKKRKPENVIIRMQIPDEVYRLIKEEIDSFLETGITILIPDLVWYFVFYIFHISSKIGISVRSLLLKY